MLHAEFLALTAYYITQSLTKQIKHDQLFSSVTYGEWEKY